MNIIRPSTITADKLHSSTVPETDYAEYAAGTTYADGDKVIVAASHKIYESLQNGNVGHAVTDTAWWLDCGYTNRWKSFDQKVTSQSSQASEMTWVFELGTYVDSLSMHNLDASSAQIIVADQAEDLITNGDDWTGANGTTPPDSWDAVNAPSDFLIDSGALKITANGANGGTSQTLAVTPETEYQMLGTYRNTSGDTAQYAIWDVTNNGIEQEAASAAGIQVSDNDNLDMATNNFALHWEGWLPDWTPSAEVKLFRKYDNPSAGVYNGFEVVITTAGKIGLVLFRGDAGATYLSTVPTGLSDGSAAKIDVDITREMLGVAGSVVFSVNEVQLGSSVSIPAAATVSISSTTPAYILGTSSTRYAGTTYAAYLFNCALSASEVLDLCRNGVSYADQWGSQTPIYTSDFSAGVDGWIVAAATIDGGIDGIGGEDDCLRVQLNTSLSKHYIFRGGLLKFKKYRVSYRYYIPSGQSHVNGMKSTMNAASTGAQTVTDAWTRVSYEHTVPDISNNLIIYAINNGSDTFQDPGGDDVFYIKDVTITPIGAVLALEPEGVRLDKWHDSSDNNLDATYPASGYSFAGEIDPITDLASSTVDKTLSVVFTTPAECETVRVSLLAKSPGDIVWFSRVSLAPTLYNETISLLNTVAVVDWYTYFYEPIVMATDLVKTDLATVEVPPISTASITMIVTNTGGTAKVGEIIMGLKFNIGKMKYRPSVSINNFSGKTIDAFGDTTITPRGWSKKLNCELILKNTVVDEVYRQYTLYKDTAIVWVGDPDHSILVVYGLWKNFEIVLPYPDYSVCNLQIEGLT